MEYMRERGGERGRKKGDMCKCKKKNTDKEERGRYECWMKRKCMLRLEEEQRGLDGDGVGG